MRPAEDIDYLEGPYLLFLGLEEGLVRVSSVLLADKASSKQSQMEYSVSSDHVEASHGFKEPHLLLFDK